MKADQLEQIKAHANAIAEILYEETDSEQVKTLEGIEVAVRKHLIDYVNPEVAKFLSQVVVEHKQEEKEA
jgi:predicted nucleic acid-binding protein